MARQEIKTQTIGITLQHYICHICMLNLLNFEHISRGGGILQISCFLMEYPPENMDMLCYSTKIQLFDRSFDPNPPVHTL